MKLPQSVQEIADVIGIEKALFLIGKLPKCWVGGKSGSDWKTGKRVQSERAVMYVPKSLKPEHDLVKWLGWADAFKLVKEFGGMILYPANCANIYRTFRNENIKRLAKEGVPVRMLADWFNVHERSVKDLIREIPQEETAHYSLHTGAINNNAKRHHSEHHQMATA